MPFLRHLWASRRLDRFVDRELEPQLAMRVSRHLDECSDCTAEVAALIGLKGALADLTGRRADTAIINRLTLWAHDELPAQAV